MTTGIPPHVVAIGAGIAGLAACRFLADVPVRVTRSSRGRRGSAESSPRPTSPGHPWTKGRLALLAAAPRDRAIAATVSPPISSRPGSRLRHLRSRARCARCRAGSHGRPGGHRQAGRHRVHLGRGRRARPRRSARLSGRADESSEPVHRQASWRRGRRPARGPAPRRRLRGRSKGPLLPGTLAPRPPPRARTIRSPRPPRLAPPASAPTSDNSRAAPIFVTLTTGSARCQRRWPRPPGPISASMRWSASSGAPPRRWRLTIGSAADPEYLDADA